MKKTIKRIFESFGIGICSLATKRRIELMEEGRKWIWIRKIGLRTVIDIGANEGQFAQKIRRELPDVSIISFEPLAGPFEKLENIFAHDRNFRAIQCALGSENTSAIIHLNQYSPSSSLLAMTDVHRKHFSFAVTDQPVEISVRRLDEVLSDEALAGPLLVKIDVQGFEDEVLCGGRNTIGRADMVIVELSFQKLYDEQPLFHDIYSRLVDLGFMYSGNIEQLTSPVDGSILQADGIFMKRGFAC